MGVFSRGLDLHIACLDHHASATVPSWRTYDKVTIIRETYAFPKMG